ncbi:hypothetical protein LINGRAHAP2_LOCUS15332 [Linum grandiflorum]
MSQQPPSFRDTLLSSEPQQSLPSEFIVDPENQTLIESTLIDDDPLKPMLCFLLSLRSAWYDEWKNVVILKLYGRSVGYFHLVNRLNSVWRTSQEVDFLDVGHGFFIAKFRL